MSEDLRQGTETQQNVVKSDVPKSLTLYVVFSISVLIIYTIVEQVLSTVTTYTHDTLTTCIFAAFGGEILSCALIKIFKLRTGVGSSTETEINAINSREG